MIAEQVWLFAKAALIGLSIAAPVGPIGVLCIRRTLAHGTAAGFVSGLGAATADGIYGAIAAFGVTAVTALLLEHAVWLRLGGGALLLWLGLTIMRARPAAADGSVSLARGYLETCALTLANPATILSFIGVFAAIGPAGAAAEWRSALVMIAGVFLGSAAWWLFLAAAVGLARARITPPWVVRINRVSGAILMAFGAAALLSLVL